MTLFDCSSGRIRLVGGDVDTHRRLVDLGLIGSNVVVKARVSSAVLVDFGQFRASVGKDTAKQIIISDGVNENRALRKSKRR
ncbi:MAG: hypothetical protein J1F33_01400 [Clostridiales bacterium]|nr:hypothetical protein [Clostridiales bacterium]